MLILSLFLFEILCIFKLAQKLQVDINFLNSLINITQSLPMDFLWYIFYVFNFFKLSNDWFSNN